MRIALLAVLLTAGAGAIVYRAWDLQVVRADKLGRMAEEQYLRDIRLAPKRGTIYDRNGAELAVSVDSDSVWANPRALKRGQVDPARAAARLGRLLEVDPGVIARRLASNRHFVWIKRRVSPRQAAAVIALRIPGVSLLPEARRFYPNRELAAHLLGYVDIDGKGIAGLELKLNDRLRGSSEAVPAIHDSRGSVVFSEHLLDDRAAHGDDIYLTIDKAIQHAAEKELELAIRTFEARAGSVVAIEPRTGELLAMADYPTFNPNNPAASPSYHRRNRAITDRFEPGSTTKAFTVAGALALGAIKPDQRIDCEEGVMNVADHQIHDLRKWEELTPSQILAYSSNIGTAKIGMAMGKAALYRTLRRFGFGEPTGLPLPGETGGILHHHKRWYEMDAATVAFGQGMSVSAVQLAYAAGAIANRGRLMEPILIKRVTDGTGRTVQEAVPRVRRRAVPAWAARLVADMMTGVTGERGTGRAAAIDGYLVAGKTGTAQKADYVNGGYAEGKWVSSFVGFVPVNDPELLVVAMVDEPVIAHHGGTVASPVFRRVAETALRNMGVAARGERRALSEIIRSRAMQRKKAAQQAVANGAKGSAAEAEPEALPPLGADEVRVPDLTGLAARPALVAARDAELELQLQGSGRVVRQSPPAGRVVKRGTRLRAVLQPPSYQEAAESARRQMAGESGQGMVARAEARSGD